MGPITLFDKSFLQMLSVNESVWFDNFFLTNVCPLFFVETLADLEKSVREGRTPEQEVGVIANKFPEMHGTPCGYHVTQCIGDLLGYRAPMTGQIPVAGGRLVDVGGKRGAVFERSPESEAFSRWQRREFLAVEREYARAWRRMLSSLDLTEVSKAIGLLGIVPEQCKTLEDAKKLAAQTAYGNKKPFEIFRLALTFLNIPSDTQRRIIRRWIHAGKPPLGDYAPYAAYVFEVELFLQVAVAANLISRERPSNRVDIAYLFYLPFCIMFVSRDNLHRRCAPLFLRPDQEFVWGQDLKDGLKEINEHYLKLPESTKEQGIMSFAVEPPDVGSGLVLKLWSRLLPKWRDRGDTATRDTSENQPPTVEYIMKMANSPPAVTAGSPSDYADVEQVVLKRGVKKKKGDWYQIPKSLKARE